MPLWVEIDLSKGFFQGAFYAAILFAVLYIPAFSWRETVTGRAMATLIVSIIGTLFRGVLLMYGVLPLSKPDSEIITGFWNVFFAWVSIISFGMFAASITVLAFQTLRVIMMESQNTITIRLLWLGKTITKRNSPVDEREPSVKP